jgi:hypothetical protein
MMARRPARRSNAHPFRLRRWRELIEDARPGRAESGPARQVRRRLGKRANSREPRSYPGPLFRPGLSNQNALMVARPRRAGRRRGVLRLAVAGQGSALSLAGAYVLAGELAKAGGRHGEAFGAYETLLRAFIDLKQREPSVSRPRLRRIRGLDCSCAIR